MDPFTVDDAFARLRVSGRDLAPGVRDAIVEAGAGAVPRLVTMLEEEELGDADARGEGWAPLHCVELLTEIGAPEAIAPLLRVLEAASPDDMLRDRIVVRLFAFGA